MFVPRWLVGIVLAVLVGLVGLSVVAQGLISPSAGRGDLQHRWISLAPRSGENPAFGFHAFKDTASNFTCYVLMYGGDHSAMECVK